jgi:hypothetical protein
VDLRYSGTLIAGTIALCVLLEIAPVFAASDDGAEQEHAAVREFGATGQPEISEQASHIRLAAGIVASAPVNHINQAQVIASANEICAIGRSPGPLNCVPDLAKNAKKNLDNYIDEKVDEKIKQSISAQQAQLIALLQKVSVAQAAARLNSSADNEVSRLIRKGKFDEAQKKQDDLADHSDATAALEHYKAGLLALARRNSPLAIRHLKSAHELAPEDQNIAYVYAVALNEATLSNLKDAATLRSKLIELLSSAHNLEVELAHIDASSGSGRISKLELQSRIDEVTREISEDKNRVTQLERDADEQTALANGIMAESLARLKVLVRGDPQYEPSYLAALSYEVGVALSAGRTAEATNARTELQVVMIRYLKRKFPNGPQAELAEVGLQCQDSAEDSSSSVDSDDNSCGLRIIDGFEAIWTKYGSQDPSYRIASALWRIAGADVRLGTPAQLDEAYRRALSGWKELGEIRKVGITMRVPQGNDFGDPRRWTSFAALTLARAETQKEQYADAETHYKEAIRSIERLGPRNDVQYTVDLATPYYEWGQLLIKRGEKAEGARSLDSAIKVYEAPSASRNNSGSTNVGLVDALIARFEVAESLEAPMFERCSYLVKAWSNDPEGVHTLSTVRQEVQRNNCPVASFPSKRVRDVSVSVDQ